MRAPAHTPDFTTVFIFATASSVRWTGHLSAISAILPRNSSETSPSMEMTRSKWSILPLPLRSGFGALFTVLDMDLGMRDVDADASERQLLVIGLLAQRYRSASAKRDRQEVVG